jgi:hypothetical protein
VGMQCCDRLKMVCMGKPLTIALLPENKAVAAVVSTKHAVKMEIEKLSRRLSMT